ncbi:MAG: hypothetical protein Q8J63_05410 [Candidatus Aquicultor sp.]|nr:hypothetical protein [Candidatus Aquicultor sp.]
MQSMPYRLIPTVIILSIVAIVSYVYYGTIYEQKPPSPVTSTTYGDIGLEPRGPGQPKWSMNHTKFVSLKEASPYIKLGILFPTYTANRKLGIIWVEKTKAQNKRTVIAMYEKGLQVNAEPLSYEDHREYVQNFAADKRSVKLTVHGVEAYGTEPEEPSEAGPRGQPGYIHWWENGVAYTVGGDGLPVSLLLKVAESTRPH